jgi:hypothetical protein
MAVRVQHRSDQDARREASPVVTNALGRSLPAAKPARAGEHLLCGYVGGIRLGVKHAQRLSDDLRAVKAVQAARPLAPECDFTAEVRRDDRKPGAGLKRERDQPERRRHSAAPRRPAVRYPSVLQAPDASDHVGRSQEPCL